MRLWIFSDLHLTDSRSVLYRSLLEVLKEPSGSLDQVIFSGDVFDLLIGNSPYYQAKFNEFFILVRELNDRGVKVHYIEGNHDFHLKKLLPPNVVFHEVAVELFDAMLSKNLYIAHGDLVDETDSGYLRLRKFLRSDAAKFFLQTVPGVWIEKIGNYFSRPFEQKARDLPEAWSEERRGRLRQVFRNFAAEKVRQGFDFVVLGHCHDLDEVKPSYFNMGYPPEHRQFLYYESAVSPEKQLLKRRNFPGF